MMIMEHFKQDLKSRIMMAEEYPKAVAEFKASMLKLDDICIGRAIMDRYKKIHEITMQEVEILEITMFPDTFHRLVDLKDSIKYVNKKTKNISSHDKIILKKLYNYMDDIHEKYLEIKYKI
jgi:hypothetical protein